MTSIFDQFLVNKPYPPAPEVYDLQSHTNLSDGRESPEDLIRSAAQKKLKFISITDHNSITALDKKSFELAENLGLSLIPGVEIDCGGGLDILVYEDRANGMSDEYHESIGRLTATLNRKRNKNVAEAIQKIKDFLTGNDTPEWITWKTKSTTEQKQILDYLNLENAAGVDLKTGKPTGIRRDYISKPHLGMLLAPFNLVDLAVFAAEFKIPLDQAPKYALGYIFSKQIPWPIDALPVDDKIVDEVVSLPFIKIVAHPGKTFEAVFESTEINQKCYETFLEDYLNRGLNGSESDYRRYKDARLDYNKLTRQFLANYQRKTGRAIYSTGGSDTHEVF